jgi:hypothetical protein
MPERATRIYKVKVTYPEGCREPGWHPARWTDPAYLLTCTREHRREIRALLRKPFKWPRERLFLSSSGAWNRAWLLRFYGAEAEVLGSLPVRWPHEPEPEAAPPDPEALTPEEAAADMAAELASRDRARELALDGGLMYQSDTAQVAASAARFRR